MNLILLAEDYENDVIYSPLNMGVRFGCDGDSYSIEEWQELTDLHDIAYNNWGQTCTELKIHMDTYASLLAYRDLCVIIDDDPDLDDIFDYINVRRTLEKLL